jgi:spore coat protein U-like protein
MSMRIANPYRLLALLCLLTAWAGLEGARTPARALGVLTCTFGMTNVAFGSIDVLPGAAFSTSATLTINCSGLSILPTNVFVCVTLPPRAMTGPASSTLLYDLLGPPPLMTSWSNSTAIVIPTSGTILSFTANATVTIPATLFANQKGAPAGAYAQTVNATVSYSTSTCTSGLIVGSGAFSFQASANVQKSCNVVATNLNFGTTGDLATAIAAQSEIDVQCSNGTGYTVALNGGLTGAANPTQRKMTFGANTITYGLYQNLGHSLPWGSTIGTNVVSGTGTSISQPIAVYGNVPVQSMPAPGTYSDTVVVSVAY